MRHTDEQLTNRIVDVAGPYAGRYVGLAVGASRGGATAVVGFGRTRAAGPVPDEDTSFQIGSVTKVVTALLLADAVRRGEVALDQRLDTLLPATVSHPNGPPITLVDLATHTAGLPRLPPGLWRTALRHRDDPYRDLTAADLVASLQRTPRRPAGGRPRYSNHGAGVLAHALEVATGRTFGELVRERVTGPLAMTATGTTGDPTRGPVASGHTRRGRPTPDWDLGALAGAGALRSTPADLLTFLHAQMAPDTTGLGAAIRVTHEPRHKIRGPLRMALGWHVVERPDGPPWWWHNGGTGGFCSHVAFEPRTRTAVVVLANTARSVDGVAVALLGSLTAEPLA